jgi:hypothetical protein
VKRAESCFIESERELTRLDNYEPHQTSLPLVNRSSCALHEGRYEEAEKMLNEALNARIAKFGKDDQESFM